MTEGRRPVVIVGAGGFGREVLDVIEAAEVVTPRLRMVGFIDDNVRHRRILAARGAELLDGFHDLRASGAGYVVAVADPSARRKLVLRAEEAGLVPVDLRHPTAVAGAVNTIGEGFVACAHVSITTNIAIGRHAHLNLNTTVGHDCTFGDFVTVNPGANISGSVTLGHNVTIGTGAVIIQGVTVGEGTVVGAGAIVTRDLPAQVVAMGAPARPVRSLA
ncbi:MAG: NeuD/PglB/VioB family sugar acetyltransferase [Actinobacteria bacterium]|nr:NeuD/PglB/VioB family sugar acetyltransferase [Actinomycetota bacterium]